MLQSNFTGVIYSSNLFKYDANSKIFTSSIKLVPAVLRHIWKDSLDIGFGMRSAKTGREIYFVLNQIERDDNGDVISWIFKIFITDHVEDPSINYLQVRITE